MRCQSWAGRATSLDLFLSCLAMPISTALIGLLVYFVVACSVLFLRLPVMIPVHLCQRLLIRLPRSSRPPFLFLFFVSFCFHIVCLIFFSILFSRHPSLLTISNICCANVKMDTLKELHSDACMLPIQVLL